MPHMNASGGDELASTDEVKVYKDEGEEEEQQKSSENLTEDKVGLVIEGEGQTPLEFDYGSKNGAESILQVPFGPADPARFAGFCGILPPYHPAYHNGGHMGFTTKMPPVPNPFSLMSLSFVNEAMGQPPPAHLSPLIDVKSADLRPASTDPYLGFCSSLPPYGIPTPPSGSGSCHPLLSPLYSSAAADLNAAAVALSASSPPLHYPGSSPLRGVSPYLSSSPYGVSQSVASHHHHSVGASGAPHPMAMPFSPSMLAAAHAAHHQMQMQFLTSMAASLPPPPPPPPPPLSLSTSSASVATTSSVSATCILKNDEPVIPPAVSKPPVPASTASDAKTSCVSTTTVTTAAPSSSTSKKATSRSSSTLLHHHSTKHPVTSSSSLNSSTVKSDSADSVPTEKSRKGHIKKPLNAFMLFMKEMRPKVQEECTLKESAAINQILGKKWHELPRDQQTKYYEMAKKEKEVHLQLYPNWSARDNYAIHTKRKKKRKTLDGSGGGSGGMGGGGEGASDAGNPKKCRARFGVERQNQWCKPCRRKKKCIRFISDTEDAEDLDGQPQMSPTDDLDDDLEEDEGVEEDEPIGSPGDGQLLSPLSPPRLYRQQSPEGMRTENVLSPIVMPPSPTDQHHRIMNGGTLLTPLIPPPPPISSHCEELGGTPTKRKRTELVPVVNGDKVPPPILSS